MDSITLRLADETIAELDSEANEHDVSRSEHIRTILRARDEYDRIRQENERLKKQLKASNARQDDIGDLVEYVERERSLQERREERERAHERAPLWRRLRWYVFGRQ